MKKRGRKSAKPVRPILPGKREPRQGRSGAPHGSRYPWSKWFNQGSFTLVRGKDYAIQTHGMAQMIRNRASARGLGVHVVIDEDTQTIQVEVTR